MSTWDEAQASLDALLRLKAERDAALAKIARVEALVEQRRASYGWLDLQDALDGPSGGETDG